MGQASTDRLWTRVTSSALLLGLVHAGVDCASAYLVFRDAYTAPAPLATLVGFGILYNTLAFGGQVPLGLLADRLKKWREMAVIGAGLVGLALVVAPWLTTTGIVVVGLGNAMFHVGAGAHVLRESGSRSAESGVFVGPGAVGLVFGTLMGLHRVPARWAIVAVLALGALVIPRIVGLGSERATVRATVALPRMQAGLYLAAVAAVVLLASSVTIRAMVGGGVSGKWSGTPSLIIALGVAACAGKMVGGFVGDRFGWITVSVAALVLSAPLVSALATTRVGAVVGMLIFQMTMPVTLKAMHHILPKRPGLAFGIPCLALLLGALPALLRALPGYAFLRPLPTHVHVIACVLYSVVLVALGLRLIRTAGGSLGPNSEVFRWIGLRPERGRSTDAAE